MYVWASMGMRPQTDYLRSRLQAVNVLEVDGGSEEEDTGPEMEEWGGGEGEMEPGREIYTVGESST